MQETGQERRQGQSEERATMRGREKQERAERRGRERGGERRN